MNGFDFRVFSNHTLSSRARDVEPQHVDIFPLKKSIFLFYELPLNEANPINPLRQDCLLISLVVSLRAKTIGHLQIPILIGSPESTMSSGLIHV